MYTSYRLMFSHTKDSLISPYIPFLLGWSWYLSLSDYPTDAFVDPRHITVSSRFGSFVRSHWLSHRGHLCALVAIFGGGFCTDPLFAVWSPCWACRKLLFFFWFFMNRSLRHCWPKIVNMPSFLQSSMPQTTIIHSFW